jgi:sarcosine oxidase subunit beta
MNFDVAIIGAGIVGSSIAYHLVKEGQTSVLVLDAGTAAGGSTGRAAGGIRAQFSTEIDIRLALHSIEFYEHFDDLVGGNINFRQYGYLFMAFTDDGWATLQRNAKLQRSMGVEVRHLSPQEVSDAYPYLCIDGLRGANFGPRDGYADPSSAAQAFLKYARERGVVVREGARVTAMEISSGKLTALQAGGERYEVGTAVIAAGPWSAEVGRLAGLELPVTPLRRHLFFTDALPEIPEQVPMTIDFETGFHFRKEGPGLLLAMPDPEETYGFKEGINWALAEKVVEAAVERVPLLSRARLVSGWSGLYEMTPDHHPIVGFTPVHGLLVAAGFSGHGFMLSPAVGRAMAELIIYGYYRTIDCSVLSLERFERGELLGEPYVL